MLSLRLDIQRGMRLTPLGFYLRVIVNEKSLNIFVFKNKHIGLNMCLFLNLLDC